jgi:diguanylate cyclase (GGDEF)-like protein/PAS domain S-box-containing protein
MNLDDPGGAGGGAGGDPRERLSVRAEAALTSLGAWLASAPLDPVVRAELSECMRVLATAVEEARAERIRSDGLFNALPDPVSIIDQEGRVLDLNLAGLRAYGRPRGEIVGRLVHVINPDLPRDHMGPVLEVLNRGETLVVEVTNMRNDGSRFPVEVHSAFFNDRGERHIVAVARDLSQRYEAELRYRQLMESVDKGIVVQDRGGRILSGNPAALRIFGIEEGERLSRFLHFDNWLVMDEQGRRIALEQMPPMRALRSGQTVDSTVLGLYHYETQRMSWLSVTSVPQFQPGSTEPQQVLSLFSDVTALKRDSALFERAQALARIGGWEWDSGRQTLYLSQEALRILGREREPADGLADVLDQMPRQDREQVEDALTKAFEGGGGFDLEVRIGLPSGATTWVRMIGEAEVQLPRTTRLTGTLQDITERKRAEERLRHQARTDPLTGLRNRDGILAEIEASLAVSGGDGAALLYIDLDRFKVVNDVLGHSAGDQLLIAAAARMQQVVGDSAVLARFGGDEFLVLVRHGSAPDLPQRLAEGITTAFDEGFRYGDEEFAITASVGLARAPGHGRTAQALLNNADAAMYDAKRRGRNTWQVFNPALASQQQERLQIESQLRRGLENEEFRLVYQPIVSLGDGSVRAAEVLLRWNNAALGEVAPARFIPHAETTGDIVRIGAWVIRQACHQICHWRKAGLPIERVAVNVSYRQFLGEDLPEIVKSALDCCGLPGSVLELEITERVLIEDAPDTILVFQALRELGVGLIIDDFGEGYSALDYLRRLPIHGIKLSRAFLAGVPQLASDVAICKAMTGIARSLGLSVVAEGVEREEQRQFLHEIGVDQAQGFLFSPAVEAEAFAALLRRAAGD